MAKVNKQGTDRLALNGISPVNNDQPPTPAGKATGKGKQRKKDERPRIGGTAVPGAKTTQPRQINTSDPSQQQMASYNHETRRRMQRKGIGPSSPSDVQNQRRKRLDKRKKRIEEHRQEAKKIATSTGAPSSISLGRRNTYFIIAVVIVIVIVIVIAILINRFK